METAINVWVALIDYMDALHAQVENDNPGDRAARCLRAKGRPDRPCVGACDGAARRCRSGTVDAVGHLIHRITSATS
jgi:hypothetical protein